MAIRVDCGCGRSTVLADDDVVKDVQCPSCGETLSGQGFVHFLCPACDRRLKVGKDSIGKKGKCPHCGNITIVSAILEDDELKDCPFCGEKIAKEAAKCRFCGEFLNYRLGGRQAAGLIGGIWRLLFGKRRGGTSFESIPIDKIECNPYQPRQHVGQEQLERLKQSVSQFGVIVPLIVRVVPGGYQLVAGQRRLRACKQLGMKFAPAIVRELSVRELIELGYLENLHRVELSSVEKAEALDRLLSEIEPGTSRRQLAQKLGRDPREADQEHTLLRLPVILQEAIAYGMVSDDQARCISAIGDVPTIVGVLERVYYNKLSLGDTQKLVANVMSGKSSLTAQRPVEARSAGSELVPLLPSKEDNQGVRDVAQKVQVA
jgi:ParB family chromosome partitioning protein